jgi:serine/threonine protein phosphatase PrpC
VQPQLKHGDTLVLCTDGLHDLVPEAGGRDNITALLVQYEKW